MRILKLRINYLKGLKRPSRYLEDLRRVALRITETHMFFNVDDLKYLRVFQKYFYYGENRVNTAPYYTRRDDRVHPMIVIGHFNRPNALELNIAAIRHFNGDQIPILISDDCSDGFAAIPHPESNYGRILRLTTKYPNVFIWPNHFRIGHSGGDVGAFWKGLNWAATGAHDGRTWRGTNGYDVLFKLSQRFIITQYNWAHDWAKRLMSSDHHTLGRNCETHGFDIRTEAVGLRVEAWFKPQILMHLIPRPLGIAAEAVVYEALQYWLGEKMMKWDLLSSGRGIPAPGYLFRETSSEQQYHDLARLLNIEIETITTEDSNQTENYVMG